MEQKKMNVTDFNTLVLKIIKRFEGFYQEETKDLSPLSRFLVVGRVLNYLFCNHYGMGIKSAEKALAKIDEAEDEAQNDYAQEHQS